MRIGINTLVAVPGGIGGTQTYLQNLIENLAKIDKENEYFLFVAPWNENLFKIKQKNFKKLICNIPSKPLFLRVLYEQIILPILAWQNKIDVFHAPANVLPFIFLRPLVLTIHDYCAFTVPELIPSVLRYYWKITLKLSARRAHFIISVSQSAKEAIANYLNVSKKKIKVIYHGSEQLLLKTVPTQNKHNGDIPYILWVGKMYTHKNLVRLLHAYNKLIKTKHIKHQLVICGMKSWGYTCFAKTVKELNLQHKIVFKGYIPHSELKPIYTNASLFVFPSLIETFGLPILEAMSCGIPVITSNYGAMAEVAGDAALSVDPYNIDEIAEAMYKVLTDQKLKEDLIKKGLERAKQFSWEKTAKETLEVYKEVYRERIRGVKESHI